MKEKIAEMIGKVKYMFPDRPDDVYADAKTYSANEMNQVIRSAMTNMLKELMEAKPVLEESRH